MSPGTLATLKSKHSNQPPFLAEIIRARGRYIQWCPVTGPRQGRRSKRSRVLKIVFRPDAEFSC